MAGAFSFLRAHVGLALVFEALGRRLPLHPRQEPKIALIMVRSSARRSSGHARQPRARQAER